MTWALIVWSALILLWAITGAAGNDCASEATQLDREACEAGTGIGVALILFIGFIGFVFFSLRGGGRQIDAEGHDLPRDGREDREGDRRSVHRGNG